MEILFVCTGNTCRSPMAQGLFNAACEKNGLPHRALSCGVAAFSGDGPSKYAVFAAFELGADIRKHFSRHITKNICAQSDRIYCMSDRHAISVLALCPEAKDKIYVLDPPIPDPYGGGLDDYRSCALALRDAVENILTEIGG